MLLAHTGSYPAVVQTEAEEDPTVEEAVHMEAAVDLKAAEAGNCLEVVAYSAAEAGNGSAKEAKPCHSQ